MLPSAGQHGDKFVAASPRQRIAVAQRLAQADAGHAQHLVADRVAERVIHKEDGDENESLVSRKYNALARYPRSLRGRRNSASRS